MTRPLIIIYFLVHLLLATIGFLVSRLFEAEVFKSVGSSMIAAGIAGMVVFFYVLATTRTSDALEVLRGAGLKNVFPARSVLIRKQYDDRLKSATERLDVIGFGLRALREDYGDSFSAWSAKFPVRILLIDPEYPASPHTFARIRDAEEKTRVGEIETDVKAFVKASSQVVNRGNFQVRLYRAIPSINYFRIDDDIFWGPYLLGGPSRKMPTLLVRRGGFLFDHLSAHFDRLWEPESSRNPPQDWYTG